MFTREVNNKMLLLAILKKMQECKNGIIRLQPIVFQIQKILRKKGITNLFNYSFIRWHYGPYSKELSKDTEHLLNKKLIEGDCFRLTEKGEKLLKKVEPFDDSNFFETIHELNQLDIQPLILKVYDENNVKNEPMGKEIESLRYVINN